MDYAKAVELAPPGWRHFGADDIDRLPEAVKRHEMARVPAHERALIEDRDTEAGERLLRAMFWTLVYHLEPERWDELAQAEPVHPDLLRAFPSAARVALDIGAGSGRLTRHLLDRASRVVAVEPAGGLRARLLELCPTADAVAGWAEALPLTDGCSQLTAACGLIGPDPAIMGELTRVTAPGGLIALISPESPEWFEAQGWRRVSMPPQPTPPHARWIDDFFGPPDPPHELVMWRVTR